MNTWSRVLSSEERAEVETLVLAAFVDAETGETRGTTAARAYFVESVHDAQARGRTWAAFMVEEWADRGAGNFAVDLWKRRDAFTATALGVQRSRALRRGRRTRTADGVAEYVQASLLDWNLEALKDELANEAMRQKEARINLETYASLIRLLKSTEAETVGLALAQVGKSLDDYLAENAAA